MIKRIKLKLKKWKIPRSVGYSALCGLLAVSCLGVWWGVDDWDEVFPTEETLAQQQRLLKKLRQEMETETQKRRTMESDWTRLHRESAYFYFSGDNRRADAFMRQKLEELAKHSGLVVKSLSDIRKQSIVKGICSWDADVMVEGDLKQMAEFLASLAASKPAFYWQQCNLRPAGPNAGNILVSNGTLKLLGSDSGELGELAEVLKQ
ncbi:MAG: hypothetical protein WCV67_11410 [Victivallaceae bacterium]|jgi:hypothetical protein